MNQVNQNPYYTSVISELKSGKDSNIEMAKILTYDSERLVAKIYTITSKQYIDDVPVFFPSLYMNTGIISPPAIDSTSLLFWGPDRQPFLLPIQLVMPNANVTNGLTKMNASPSSFDKLLTLQNIQSGEHLIRALTGAYLFIKNNGQIELGTNKMHQLSLDEKNGAFKTSVERTLHSSGGSQFYLGPASLQGKSDMRNHLYFDMNESADRTKRIETIENSELLERVMQDEIDNIPDVEPAKIYVKQMGHVFNEEGALKYDPADGSELFSEKVLEKGDVTRTETLSKRGTKRIKLDSPSSKVEVELGLDKVRITKELLVDGEAKKTEILIDEQGNIVCEQNGKRYELMPVLEWFYENK